MKLSKNDFKDRITLELSDSEFEMIVGALTAASSDIARKGFEYVHFYGAEREEVVGLLNEIRKQNENC